METLIHSNKYSIVYGRKNIDFSLLYCDRKTMEIAVHPDSTIIVKAPVQYDITLIEKKIIKRARWILRQLNYFKQFSPKTPDRCYVNGETHLYLGKPFRLKLAKGQENSVKLSRGFFHVNCRNEPTPNVAKKLLNQWYSEKAQLQFAESMERCWQKFNGLGIGKPNLSVKRMQKRWGSLSNKGTVTLNTDLVKAPKECIDYVVTHELCHLKYHNHSPDFYKLLDSVIPGWEKIKHKLEVSMS
ncbi:SprT family zinc-dependent metalloprotease [Desulfobacter sp.]|uniref:M48 family metallopeptidase n=1 Tax=Desulfobacter sp. TaxID=2294 RepID=UPI000E9A7E9B|nr:SprT family zinc-dependent metalloprotease [Desulfobacter sp.]HBT89682.1 M48 family peptidase [Desulfobacter sp.]